MSFPLIFPIMSGFEIVGAIAAAGQLVEQGSNVIRFIRAVRSQIADGPEQMRTGLRS